MTQKKNKYKGLTHKEKDKILHMKDKEIQMLSVNEKNKRIRAIHKENLQLKKKNKELLKKFEKLKDLKDTIKRLQKDLDLAKQFQNHELAKKSKSLEKNKITKTHEELKQINNIKVKTHENKIEF